MRYAKRSAMVIIPIVMLLMMTLQAFGSAKTVKMVDMHEADSDNVTVRDTEVSDSYGNVYSGNVLAFDTGRDAFIDYDLNGAYESFDASIVGSTDTGSEAVMNIGFFADGEKVYEIKGFTKQKAAESVHLDLTGVGTLSIKTELNKGYSGYLYFVDSIFEECENPAHYNKRTELNDLVVIDSSSCNISDRLFTDTFGNIHNGSSEFTTGRDGYVLYNLDGKFVEFTGCIVAGTNTGSEAVMNIKMYLDDREIFSQNNITKNTAQIDFTLDVTDGKVLKIVTSKESGYSDYLFVADGLLKAHEHTLGEWNVQKEATCTEDGEKVQNCTVCGEAVVSEKIEATGHKPDGKWTIEKEPTCKEKGINVQHCEICKSVCEETSMPLIDHDFGEWKTVSGSVWDNPIVKERTCSMCGEVEKEESSPTPWLKMLVIFGSIFGGIILVLIIIMVIIKKSTRR